MQMRRAEKPLAVRVLYQEHLASSTNILELARPSDDRHDSNLSRRFPNLELKNRQPFDQITQYQIMILAPAKPLRNTPLVGRQCLRRSGRRLEDDELYLC